MYKWVLIVPYPLRHVTSVHMISSKGPATFCLQERGTVEPRSLSAKIGGSLISINYEYFLLSDPNSWNICRDSYSVCKCNVSVYSQIRGTLPLIQYLTILLDWHKSDWLIDWLIATLFNVIFNVLFSTISL